MISIRRPSRPHGQPRILGAGAILLLACSFTGAHAARTSSGAPIADFERMSGARAGDCDGPADAGLAELGSPSLRRCAWGQRVEMLYWNAIPVVQGACLPPPAVAWQSLTADVGADSRPWDLAWSGQAKTAGGKDIQQALAVWKESDGHWSAIAWRWRPSSRPATRAWESGHWDAAVKAMQAVNVGNPPPQPSLLLDAWLAGTHGKPRMIDSDSWRWVSENTCLVMRTAGISQGQLHLPYSRDDARLEQRSGMQLQLARRFPAAEWLQPFTLLDPAAPGTRSGTKFLAVWREGATVQGQLWIPLADGGGIVRARIGTDVPANKDARSQELIKQRAAIVQRELTGMAHAWEARHER